MSTSYPITQLIPRQSVAQVVQVMSSQVGGAVPQTVIVPSLFGYCRFNLFLSLLQSATQAATINAVLQPNYSGGPQQTAALHLLSNPGEPLNGDVPGVTLDSVVTSNPVSWMTYNLGASFFGALVRLDVIVEKLADV